MAACRTAYLSIPVFIIAFALSLAFASTAYAETISDLKTNYKLATSSYDAAIDERKENAKEITAVEGEIKAAQAELEQSKERLSDSAVAMYKHERSRSDMLDALLASESINDAVVRYEGYKRIEQYWTETVEAVKKARADLDEKKNKLEEKRESINEKVENSAHAVKLAEAALKDADHSDGAKYHQRQGNGSNCGATSFIVGVNILLHENRYTDNVEVWNGPGFDGDSTQSLDFKGATWLMANGLSDQISCEGVVGDIHYTEQLQGELEEGKVVIISSGSGSVWQRANDMDADANVFPDGHWIVFYYYDDENGLFYANDSSVGAKKGAGCVYTTEQMQQWLNGRGNHFATVLAKKHFGEQPESD